MAKSLLDHGIQVVAHDPAKPKNPIVPLSESAQDSVAGADVIFSLNSSAASIRLAEQVSSWLKPGAIYCDLNSSTPSLKKRIAEIVPVGSFVDVSLMKPASGSIDNPSMAVSGPAAAKLVELFEPLGWDLAYVSPVAGDAAARNLIQSLVSKGLASVIIDALWAAKELGLEEWALEELKNEFEISSAQTVQGFIDTTGTDSKIHSVALGDVVEMLSDANYESTMLNGIAATLSKAMHGKKIPFANAPE